MFITLVPCCVFGTYNMGHEKLHRPKLSRATLILLVCQLLKWATLILLVKGVVGPYKSNNFGTQFPMQFLDLSYHTPFTLLHIKIYDLIVHGRTTMMLHDKIERLCNIHSRVLSTCVGISGSVPPLIDPHNQW